nr:hypothetical protein [Streptomyces flavochromogenes]
MLASLGLPGEAGEHLAARAALLDGTYREVAGRLPDDAQIVFGDGRLNFAALESEPEPASLLDMTGGGERDAAGGGPARGAAGGVLLDRRRPSVHLGHRRRTPTVELTR